MRALIYARVSTTDKEQDPRPQLREMTEFCGFRRWSVALEEVDQISSAEERPGWKRILAAARARKGDVVLCRHFDRIARSTKELLELLDEFRALGIDFISLNQQVDTTTPHGKLMFTIIAAVAEFERAMTRERVKLGLADARRRGQRLGRPRVDADVEKIRMLWQSGVTGNEIARQMNISPSSVRRILKRL
jgi:DNA invertase Pin-like site-specific DNA recombinase